LAHAAGSFNESPLHLVWASDTQEAARLRTILTAAGCEVSTAVGSNTEPRVLDLEIGGVAGEGLEALQAAGYSFLWHPTQHVLNRGATVLGLPIG
jgi:hypothetical protein